MRERKIDRKRVREMQRERESEKERKMRDIRCRKLVLFISRLSRTIFVLHRVCCPNLS